MCAVCIGLWIDLVSCFNKRKARLVKPVRAISRKGLSPTTSFHVMMAMVMARMVRMTGTHDPANGTVLSFSYDHGARCTLPLSCFYCGRYISIWRVMLVRLRLSGFPLQEKARCHGALSMIVSRFI